jgi:hypothetical protein
MVIKSIQAEFSEHLRWMWVTRYGESLESVLPVTTTDDSPEKEIPQEFIADGFTRRIIFRTACDETTMGTVQRRLLELTQENSLHTRITPYDLVQDLGSDRFAAPYSDANARARRAELVMLFVDATVRLMLDALIVENGQWTLQKWEHRENRTGSFFDSIHHLFCNLTNLSLPIQLQMTTMQDSDDEIIMIRTPYMPGFTATSTKHIMDKFSWVYLKS